MFGCEHKAALCSDTLDRETPFRLQTHSHTQVDTQTHAHTHTHTPTHPHTHTHTLTDAHIHTNLKTHTRHTHSVFVTPLNKLTFFPFFKHEKLFVDEKNDVLIGIWSLAVGECWT